ncbi:MAG: heparinase II/III family protein [candidate division Zixibacteria bacterium]|nr:heparinase II/III family protein [candidate division Zixibacteria bacterium]
MKPKTKKIFSKFTKASLGEALFRLREELIKVRERHQFSRVSSAKDGLLAKLNLDKLSIRKDSANSIGQLANYYRMRKEPKFFIDGKSRHELLEILVNRFSQDKKECLEEADAICQGKYDIFSYPKLDWGMNLDWHLDKVNNKKAPLVFWDEINYLDFDLVGDSKITWEINRHQHFITLGRAYWYSGDEKYAEEFARQVESWIRQNPVNLGINWTSSLELALRIYSWIWGFYFFRESQTLSGEFMCNMLNSIYLQAKHVQSHLSYYFSPNTHLIGEGFGLFLVGTFFPEFKQAKTWQKIGLKILKDELKKQVGEDGVHVEGSTYYHRYTADFYQQALILSEKNNIPLPWFFRPKLEKMLEFIAYITKPDGKAPMVGDADGGRVCPIGTKDVNDYSPTLSTGAVIFKRRDFKFVAKDLSQETIWLLGEWAKDEYENLGEKKPEPNLRYFRESGFLVMRSGWQEDDKYLIIDAGPFGWKDCPHSHDDFASFELAIGEKTFICDPGTYCYTLDGKWRDSFRQSRAHNVVLIDGKNRSQPKDFFEWKNKTEGKLKAKIFAENFGFVSTQQKINHNRGQSFSHQRKITYLQPDYWIVEDVIYGERAHNLELLFHLGEVKSVLSQNDKRIELDGGNGKSLLVVPLKKNDISMKLEEGWVSQNYGQRTSSKVLNLYGEFSLPVSLITILFPTDQTLNRVDISSVYSSPCGLGNVFKIERDKIIDYFICQNKKIRLKNPIIPSDAEIGFLRIDEYDRVTKAFLINGSFLKYKDKAIFNYPKKVPFLEL